MKSTFESRTRRFVMMTAWFVFLSACVEVTWAADANGLDQAFSGRVLPVIRRHCGDCHGAADPDGGLDLIAFESADRVVEHFAVWDLVRRRVADKEMPPPDSGIELTDSDRETIVGWINRLRDDHAARNAGDPGEVLARRLSAAEYNYTIRDLTGVDIRPAAEFPVDPTNEAGFDNSGESLMMTPSLMEKYIQAARVVSEHLVFGPYGLHFAPHPVVTETDRDKYCVRRIVDFYQQQNTDLGDYLAAAIRWNRSTRGPQKTIAEIAAERGLSRRYLVTVLEWLDDDSAHVGAIKDWVRRVRKMEQESGPIDRDDLNDIVRDAEALRGDLGFEFPHLSVDGINRGSQPLVLWRNRQKASHRMSLNRDALAEQLGETEPHAETIEAFANFCRIFPDRFYVDRRGREYVNRGGKKDFNQESEYRLLSAGFHSMMGYFRDDQPLVELMLTQRQREELNRLWFELNFIADVPRRQHSGFIWFERAEGRFLVDAEFDAFQAADKDLTDETKIKRLRDAYLAKAERLEADDRALDAMREHFRRINTAIRRVESSRHAARQAHLNDLVAFAGKAFRRPLTDAERADTLAFYDQLVDENGLSHEDSVRDVLVSVLMSPHFCFRLRPSPSTESIHRSDDFALASRLSYFLWSSMPDDTLLSAARRGELRSDQGLKRQARRMLRDPKTRGLAVEFGANWLGSRQFQSHNSVDRIRFQQFDDALRESMFEEPIRFTLDVMQHGGSVFDFLYADHTFVDATLAKHYGIEGADKEGWHRVDAATEFGRGGILPMAVFLTKNSPGLRTSPVKRGFWVVKQLLGTSIPAPPPDVPDLPEDEADLGDLTLRQLLAKHRDHESCAGCHEKFDSFGLVFENYGPIGERRESDLGGRPVDTTADFPDGMDRQGVTGLRDYLRQGRDRQFVENLCRKLTSFALGRSLILSDEPFIEHAVRELTERDPAFENLVLKIVTSDAFVNQRGANDGGMVNNKVSGESKP